MSFPPYQAVLGGTFFGTPPGEEVYGSHDMPHLWYTIPLAGCKIQLGGMTARQEYIYIPPSGTPEGSFVSINTPRFF